MSKSLFASRTFWFNIAALAVHVSGLLPAKYAIPVAAIGNVGLRILTETPVTVLPQ